MTNLLLTGFSFPAALPHDAASLLNSFWNIALRGTVILMAAFGISVVSRRASAAAQHLIWVCVFCGLLALPALSLIVPSWQIPAAVMSQASNPKVIKAGKTLAPGPNAPMGRPAVSSVEGAHEKSTALPLDISKLVFWVWAIGFAIVLGRLAVGSARVGWMTRQAQPKVHTNWTGLLENLAGELRLKRRVKLAQCDAAMMPMAWGFLRPVILLPHEADQWSVERRRVVLSHELAHVQRQDCLTQLIAQLACAMYWFHPLVWLTARKLRQESERACDDRVLNLGTKPSDYAEHLLDLAGSLKAPQASWAAAVAMAKLSQLEGRMVAMLDPGRNRRRVTRSRALLMPLLFTALILPIAGLRGLAGSETGKLAGRVFDPSGGVVSGAVITVTNLERHSREAMISGSDGEFEFPAIPTGKYLIDVSKRGFGVFQRQNFDVSPGKDSRLDVILEPGLVVESVEVVAKGHRKTPASADGRPKRIRAGGDVEAANLLTQVKPVYPESAVEQGIEGTVLINAVIGIEGNVLSAHVINEPDSDLGKAALDAVKQWHYRPTHLNGEPIEVVTTITVRFKLEE